MILLLCCLLLLLLLKPCRDRKEEHTIVERLVVHDRQKLQTLETSSKTDQYIDVSPFGNDNHPHETTPEWNLGPLAADLDHLGRDGSARPPDHVSNVRRTSQFFGQPANTISLNLISGGETTTELEGLEETVFASVPRPPDGRYDYVVTKYDTEQVCAC